MHLQAMTGAGKSYFLYFSQMVFDVVADYAERKTIIQLSLFLAQSNSGVVADYAEQSFIIAF